MRKKDGATPEAIAANVVYEADKRIVDLEKENATLREEKQRDAGTIAQLRQQLEHVTQLYLKLKQYYRNIAEAMILHDEAMTQG